VTRLLQLTPSNGLILIGGIARAATDILLSLPSSRRSQAMLLRGLDIHASPAVIARHVDQALEEWQEGTDHEEVQRLADHYLGRGRASLGEQQTLMALQRGAVEQLYVSEAFLLQHLDATESVLQLAVAHRARIACVKGSAAETLTRTGGGVAARLRFSHPASTIDREQATIRV
jgi:peptide subunit release factor 1 (eRF1)